MQELSQRVIFPPGQENTAYAQSFTGTSCLNMLTTQGVPIGNVTFEPGCRNHRHIHRASQGGGQILLVTGGRGWYQAWGEPARPLQAGDVVVTPQRQALERRGQGQLVCPSGGGGPRPGHRQ